MLPPSRPARAQSDFTVVMSGLDNPRGLAFGPDGGLYVTEAGRGGDKPGLPSGDGRDPQFLGATGAITRYLGGTQQRIVTGLPSLAPANGGGATGPHDITFDAQGNAYVVVGLGANPADRAGLGAGGATLGHLLRLPAGGARRRASPTSPASRTRTTPKAARYPTATRTASCTTTARSWSPTPGATTC